MNGPETASPGARASLRVRLLVGALAWVTITMLASTWVLTRVFEAHLVERLGSELGVHIDQLIAHLSADEDGMPEIGAPLSDPRFSRPRSGLYWQIDTLDAGGRPLAVATLRSRSLWDEALQVPDDVLADGERHMHRLVGSDGARLRMLEQAVRPPGAAGNRVRLVVAIDEANMADAIAHFNRMSMLALAILCVGGVLLAALQLQIAMRPLAVLRRELTAMREGRRERFEAHYPSEIQPVVDELNGVLARNAEMVQRARTQAGNLAHALKTPLSVLANAAAAEQGDLAGLVAEQVRQARAQVDRHLARARAAAAASRPGRRTPVAGAVEGLVRLFHKVHAGRMLDIAVTGHPELAFRGEEQDLQELLGNVIDNACKWARHRICIDVGESSGRLRIDVDDDGPGVPEAQRAAILARGVRADERMPGSGLGLAIVAEFVALYGGQIELLTSPLGGLRVRLLLPAA
ncbi:MAG: ATP-binding protein [Rhodocyclaceae bacterium]